MARYRGPKAKIAEQYAREAFVRYQADAVTLSPFMGFDSIEPYLPYDGKGLILLCRTSNPGGSDLQFQTLANGDKLYEHVAKLAAGPWNRDGRLGLVVGATFPAELARVRPGWVHCLCWERWHWRCRAGSTTRCSTAAGPTGPGWSRACR